MFAYESVPGSVVTNFKQTENAVSFEVEAASDVQITLEMEEGKEYSVSAGGADLGTMKTATGGKLTISLELTAGNKTKVEVKEK